MEGPEAEAYSTRCLGLPSTRPVLMFWLPQYRGTVQRRVRKLIPFLQFSQCQEETNQLTLTPILLTTPRTPAGLHPTLSMVKGCPRTSKASSRTPTKRPTMLTFSYLTKRDLILYRTRLVVSTIPHKNNLIYSDITYY